MIHVTESGSYLNRVNPIKILFSTDCTLDPVSEPEINTNIRVYYRLFVSRQKCCLLSYIQNIFLGYFKLGLEDKSTILQRISRIYEDFRLIIRSR